MQKVQNVILSSKLKKYADIFLIEETNKLSLNKELNYVIKTNAESFYESLYNLFNTKLATLKQYLNNIFTKE